MEKQLTSIVKLVNQLQPWSEEKPSFGDSQAGSLQFELLY